MRFTMLIFFSVISFITSCATCSKGEKLTDNNSNRKFNNTLNDTTSQMKITIGSKIFTASLFNNPATEGFKALLPLTINMTELNGNEKYFHLSADLPSTPSNPGTIRSGDLMLWGSNSLVLFYKTFSTSYSYTKLGRINDPEGLAAAVGSGSVTVTFELE